MIDTFKNTDKKLIDLPTIFTDLKMCKNNIMNNIELSLSSHSNNDQYSLIKGNAQCSNCSNSVRVTYYYKTAKYNLCEFCNTVYKYCARNMMNGIICKTKLKQVDIVRKTYDLLKQNKKMPKITEVDPDARIVDHAFPEILSCMKHSDFKNIPNNISNDFSDFKLFFTDMIDYNGFPFFSMFNRPKKQVEYFFFEDANINVPKISLTKNQILLVDKYGQDNVDYFFVDSK